MGKNKKGHKVDEEAGRPSFFIGDDKEQVPIKIVGPDEEEINADEIIIAPDGGWGWVVAFASFLSNVVVDGIIFSFGLMAEPILSSFQEAGLTDVSLSSIAWIGSLQSGFYLLGGPFVSALANKFGFRMVAILGAIVATLGFVASYAFCLTSPSLVILFTFYGFVGGIGFNLLYVPSVIAVGFYFEKYRALATGIAICGSGVGTFIFAPLTYYLINSYGWRVTMLIQAGLVLSCSLCGAMYRPVKPTKVKEGDSTKAKGDGSTEQGKKLLTPFPSPEGTPLLMRIKRAREMEKWDSVNSVENEPHGDLHSITQARKASTQSLTNSNPLHMHKQAKRMSVPSLLLAGDVPMVRANTQVPMRNKSNVGDLKEIEEIEENEVNEGDEGLSSKEQNQDSKKEAALFNPPPPNSSMIITQKIGNSTYFVDEMTKSRILRVSSKSIINKPMYRDDIFYSGSMKRIPEYAETVERGNFSSVEWSAIVSRKPSNQFVDGLRREDPAKPDTKKKKLCAFFKKFDILSNMLDFSLLSSPSFVLVAVGGGITMLGFFVPFMFLKGIAVQNGVAESDAPLLISVIGIANTVGRIICGWIADRPEVNAVVINNVALTIGGLVNIAAPFFHSYWLFILYSVIFGLSIACFASLRSILVVELLGLSKLTNAFGLLCLFQGIAAMCGSPLAGFLYDTTGNFDMTFYVAGGLMLFSGIICYPIQCVNRREKNKIQNEK